MLYIINTRRTEWIVQVLLVGPTHEVIKRGNITTHHEPTYLRDVKRVGKRQLFVNPMKDETQ